VLQLIKISEILLESYRELAVQTERQATQMQRYGIADDNDPEYIGVEVLDDVRQPHSSVKKS
jgi:hypothetical protein